MHPEIETADEEVRLATERRKQTIDRIQAVCSHPAEAIVECESYGDYIVIPPRRCCLLCGYAEEGWGCGYWKLGAWGCSNYLREYPQVSRQVMQDKYIKRLLTQYDMRDSRYGERLART